MKFHGELLEAFPEDVHFMVVPNADGKDDWKNTNLINKYNIQPTSLNSLNWKTLPGYIHVDKTVTDGHRQGKKAYSL